MSANFYKITAPMHGIDLHHFQMVSPNPADALKGTRLDNWMYRVSARHLRKHDPGKVADTVSADGKCMIRDGFKIRKVDHNFMMLAPPHPYEWIEQRKIIDESSSTPFLTRASVTSSGDALAVCSVGAIGANLNCHDSGMVLSGIVWCPCSVVTKTQIVAIVERIFEDIKKIIVAALPKIIELLATRFKKLAALPRAVVEWAVEKIVVPMIDEAKAYAKAIAAILELVL